MNAPKKKMFINQIAETLNLPFLAVFQKVILSLLEKRDFPYTRRYVDASITCSNVSRLFYSWQPENCCGAPLA